MRRCRDMISLGRHTHQQQHSLRVSFAMLNNIFKCTNMFTTYHHAAIQTRHATILHWNDLDFLSGRCLILQKSRFYHKDTIMIKQQKKICFFAQFWCLKIHAFEMSRANKIKRKKKQKRKWFLRRLAAEVLTAPYGSSKLFDFLDLWHMH